MCVSSLKRSLTRSSILQAMLHAFLPLSSFCASSSMAQAIKERPFWPEIQAFLETDKTQGLTSCRTLFVGSSSIRFWTSLKRDLPELRVIRRGFGGAHLTHVIRYFNQLTKPHKPREIILYAGENDIAAARSPKKVLAALKDFLAAKTNSLGPTPVYFVAIEPSIYHWDKFDRQSRTNQMIKTFSQKRADLVFIDVVPLMLHDGRPKDIFMRDKLHMNRDGYALWTVAVRRALKQANAPKATYCKS